ncbi:MAG: hypothetical protein KC619_07250, partial [Myxococcales bacterium]|nr:hypothetical protein [Myxococcales bacterium]
MARTPPLLSGAAMSLLVHAGATLALITLPSARSLHKELEPKLHRLVDVEPVETVGGGADRSRVGQRPFDAALAE